MNAPIDIRHYITRDGRDVFDEWLMAIADARTKAKISARINRLACGNFGDCKPLRDGVWELRVDWGPGYRIYYSMVQRTEALVLCAGDKRKQASDIDRAVRYLREYQKQVGDR